MNVVAFIYAYRYWALPIATFFEGPIVMTLVGFLVGLGYFSFWPALLLMALGDLLGDIAWYSLGYYGASKLIEKIGRFFSLTEEKMERTKVIFNRHQAKIILISKITMGFGLAVPVLITAGISKIPLKKFIMLNLIGGLIWTAFLMFLGYTLGNIYLVVEKGLRNAFIITAVIFIVAALYGFSRYWRRRAMQNKL